MLWLYLIGRSQTPRNAKFKGSDSPDAGMLDTSFFCLGETISIVYDMEGQNFEVDGGSSVALCQWKKCKLQHQPGFTEQ